MNTTPKNTVSAEFAKTALLASVTIRQWGAKKEDKKVSRKVAKDNGADADSGNYQKHLVPKEALEAINKATTALRQFHQENTLPWLDEGIRCLPSMNYESYKTQVDGLKDAFETAVRDFAQAWPEVVAKARKSLGALFNEDDYPADITSRFGVDVRFRGIADADDFRVNVSDLEREMLRKQIRGELDAAGQAAMEDLYRRLSDGVKAMAERLRAYNPEDPTTGKASGIFRDSLVENLRDLVALVPKMNFAGDEELEAIRAEVEGQLCGADAQELRDNDSVRTRTAESAEAIAARLGEYMA